MLRRMCREHKLLPSSYTITDEVKRIGESPSGCGGNADVWRGVYRDSKVAIKVLRVHTDFARAERVRFLPILFHNTEVRRADESWIELLP